MNSISSIVINNDAPDIKLIMDIIADRKKQGESYKGFPKGQRNRLFQMMLDREQKEIKKNHELKRLPESVQNESDVLTSLYISKLVNIIESGVLNEDYFLTIATRMNNVTKNWYKHEQESLAQLPLSPRLIKRLEKQMMCRKYEFKLGYKRSYNNKKVFNEKIDLVSTKLRMAEKDNRTPNSITDQEAENFILNEKREQSDRIMAELIAEEEKEKQTKNAIQKTSRRRGRNRKRKKNTTQSLPQTVKNSNDQVKQVRKSIQPRITKEELRGKYILNLYQRNPLYREDSRVTKRWSTRDLNLIRDFKDKDMHNREMQRYKTLTDEEIEKQRARHYLPGTELIISDSNDRNIYSFPTKHGVGMMAELHIGNDFYYGVLYMGIGKDNVIYHKYFEDLDQNQLTGGTFNDGENITATEKSEEENEWVVNSKFKLKFEVSEQGILTIKYPDEKHFIQIHPVRRDFLNPELFIR